MTRDKQWCTNCNGFHVPPCVPPEPVLPDGCWICGEKDVAYTDALGLKWCVDHFKELYLDDLY